MVRMDIKESQDLTIKSALGWRSARERATSGERAVDRKQATVGFLPRRPRA
ncbi:MAG: hypothetical protein NVSMB9_04800 [Isosphaeraceae bacterium]